MTPAPLPVARSRDQAPSSPGLQTDALVHVRSAARALARARSDRAMAISVARKGNMPLWAIAEAADLSVSRIKQLPPVRAGEACATPVTETDLQLVPRKGHGAMRTPTPTPTEGP